MGKQIFDPTKAIVVPGEPGTKRRAFVVAGPPGTGKSTLLGSMAKTLSPERCLLLATLGREIDSWLYQQYRIPYILFEDDGWAPALMGPGGEILSQGSYSAMAFKRFLDTLDWLHDVDEQYDGIIVDSGTELGEAGWRLALSAHSAGSPSEMDGKSRWLPYEALDSNLDRAIKGLLSLTLTAKRPKHVGISWHVQPPKDDTTETVGDSSNKVTVKKASADRAAEGVEYEGKVLPMVRGRFRRRLAGLVPTIVYTDVKTEYDTSGLSVANRAIKVEYRLQVRPDMERHTKLPGPLPQTQYIPNDFAALLALLEQQETVIREAGKSFTRKP